MSTADMSKATDRHQGARIVLFSGGTAMNPTARQLKQYTAQTLHLLPPFDSGGSSAELRRHWPIAAVGDLRSRLIALADDTHPTAHLRAQLLDQRLPESDLGHALPSLLKTWADEALALNDGDPDWTWLCVQLRTFVRSLPPGFELAGASFGNLILAAGLIVGHEDLPTVSERLAHALHARGQAHAIVDANLHLAARLANGQCLIGQHQLTGKERSPISSPIVETWLNQGLDNIQPGQCEISATLATVIRRADLIVYGPGSFHSSLMAQFLPTGVCAAITASRAHKVYVPNLGHDPELLGCSPDDALHMLTSRLRDGSASNTPAIDSILVDTARRGDFPCDAPCINAALATADGKTHDPTQLAQALLELLSGPFTSRL